MPKLKPTDMISSRIVIEEVIFSESFRSKAYLDTGGVWTIGFGRTEGVKAGNTTTVEKETERMINHIEEVESAIHRLVDVELTQFEFDALVCFVYNIGTGAFAKSTMLKRLNERNCGEAAKEFDKWVYANGVKLNGLVARRNREEALFTGKDV